MPKEKKKKFINAFLKDRDIAAISRSSPILIKHLIRHLDLPNIKVLVELGPADGVATKPILKGLPADARVIALEKNRDFAAELRSWPDKRLEVIEDDARHIKKVLEDRGINVIDAAVASIPFTYLTNAERRELVVSVKKLLKPGGVFIIFHQYSPLMLPYMKKTFRRVRLEFEALNLFPCFLIIGCDQ
jgi:phosphatidylethanolamine/phosphatidyl-N-methylethanolamine N-methyltransferase